MTKRILIGIIFSLAILTVAACGGGGGDSGTPAVYTTATVKISLTGSPGGKGIAGAGFTLTLPANVTPTMVNDAVASGVVTCSGTFAGNSIAPVATYTPATGSTQGTLRIVLSSSVPAGVTTAGEVATVALKLANSATPAAAGFPLNSISVIDTLGGAITGMTATVSGVVLN